MQTVPLENLKEVIGQPEVRPYLEPLLRFRGFQTIHRIQALWNFANAMLMSECQSFHDAVKMYGEGDLGHLCGMHAKTLSHISLVGFFNRVRQTPRVAAIIPGMLEYSRWINPYKWDLQVIGHGRAVGRMNADVQRSLNKELGRSADRFYPFISRESDHHLLMAVHSAVPKNLDRTVRADLCQDLLVGVMSGDIHLENLRDAIPLYAKEAFKFRPKEAMSALGMENRLAKHGDDWKKWYVPECCEEYLEGDMALPADWLEQIKGLYPKRHGDQGWSRVKMLVPFAIRNGAIWAQIFEGVRAYRAYCDLTEKTGTEFVKMARTFFGPDQCWMEDYDAPPAKAKAEKERLVMRTLEQIQADEAVQYAKH